MDKEILIRAQQIEQEAKEVEQNIEIVEQQIGELKEFRHTLENFDKSNEKDMLSMLGKGVYAKTEIKEMDLYVNVGANIIVKKSPKDTIKIIDEQTKRLGDVRMQLKTKGRAYAHAFQQILEGIQEERKQTKIEKGDK
jgi:prefoldin alpha subunit